LGGGWGKRFWGAFATSIHDRFGDNRFVKGSGGGNQRSIELQPGRAKKQTRCGAEWALVGRGFRKKDPTLHNERVNTIRKRRPSEKSSTI